MHRQAPLRNCTPIRNPPHAILTFEGIQRPETPPESQCCCRSKEKLRTRRPMLEIPPVHTACDPVVEQRGLPLMPTPRIRRISDAGRNPADYPPTSILEHPQERVMKGEVGEVPHEGPVLRWSTEGSTETLRASIPHSGRSQVRRTPTATRAGRGASTSVG